MIADVPLLIANDEERRQLVAGGREARLAFYKSRSDFLRRNVHDEQMKTLYRMRGEGIAVEVGNGQRDKALDPGVICVDLSIDRLVASAGAPGICASAETLPFPSGSVSFLSTVATLEHVVDPSRAFEEIDRVLAVGGIAYVAPAWHCREWMADGIPVRPYRDLTMRQRFTKVMLPFLDSIVYRGLTALPRRLLRRASWLIRRRPTGLRFKPIRANYETFWMSDSDACSSIDSHEGALFFHSREYEMLRPGGDTTRQLLFRAGPLIVRKRVVTPSRNTIADQSSSVVDR